MRTQQSDVLLRKKTLGVRRRGTGYFPGKAMPRPLDMLDLPAELRGQFISELTEQASSRGNDDDAEYFMEVQGVLKTDKNYVKAFHGQSSTIDRVRSEVMGG